MVRATVPVVFLAVVFAPLSVAASSDYVDSGLCAGCHQKIAEDYAKTGMGRSFFRPAAQNQLEDYSKAADVFHADSDTHFAMLSRNGQLLQRRWQTGPGGAEINVEEMKIDYVMGSGNHARSYLHRTARGTLIELPLGWYAEGAHWNMSPGSDSGHPRTRRFISYKCMFCHNAVPQIPAGSEAFGSAPVFAGDLPEGIDCQRCHGPGGRHLEVVAKRGSTAQDLRASIVNPARLPAPRRMEICMQCHLETSSGRIPATLVRFNRGPFSFLPGEPLEAFMLNFDHAPGTGHEDKFEAVSSVYRLRQSRCFLRSEGKLSCETCHNPHRAPRGEEAAAHYTAVCRQCHSVGAKSLTASAQHTATANCIPCHMPRRRAEDTPGMVMTDHLIQRQPPARDLLAALREPAPEEYRGEVVPYYPAPLPATPPNALYRAVAQVALGNNPQAGLPALAREIAAQKPREAEAYAVLGDSLLRAGKARDAVAAFEQAAQRSPASASVLRSLASALIASDQPVRAADTLRRALSLAPSDALSWYQFGLLDFRAGRDAEAAEKIRKAISLDSTLPDQSRSLGEVLLRQGQLNAAQQAFTEALRTDPYDDAAWDLQGRLLTERGQMPDAVFSFERAIRLRPKSATNLYDYALALVRMNRFDQARTRAEAAVDADPKSVPSHELLGRLFERDRNLGSAAAEYRTVLELQPSMGSAHLRLGTVLIAQGNAQSGLDHLRLAAKSADPDTARQAAEAIRQLGAAR